MYDSTKGIFDIFDSTKGIFDSTKGIFDSKIIRIQIFNKSFTKFFSFN